MSGYLEEYYGEKKRVKDRLLSDIESYCADDPGYADQVNKAVTRGLRKIADKVETKNHDYDLAFRFLLPDLSKKISKSKDEFYKIISPAIIKVIESKEAKCNLEADFLTRYKKD